jgi:hypothetical protein
VVTVYFQVMALTERIAVGERNLETIRMVGDTTKVGDEISLIINDGAITISHVLTSDDIANRRYEFWMSDSVIVTDVTNVVGVHLGTLGSSISTYANPVSIPYTLLAPAAYAEGLATDEVLADTESVSQPLQFSILMSEILVDESTDKSTIETEDFTVSNGTVSSVSMVDSTHYTLEVISDGHSPLGAVSVEIVQPVVSEQTEPQPLPELLLPLEVAEGVGEGNQEPDPSDFMLLELGGVTYVIDTSSSNQSDSGSTDDYALTNSLSAPLVAGSWTEVITGTESSTEELDPHEQQEPVNPLTDTSAPPMINTDVLDDPRLTDNGSWTP